MSRFNGTPNLLHRAAHSVQPPRLGRNRVDLDRRLLRLGEHRDFKTARSRWSAGKLDCSADQLLIYHELAKPLAGGKPLRLEFAVLTKTQQPAVELYAKLLLDLARPEGQIVGIEEELRGELSPDCPDLLARVDLLLAEDDALVVRDFRRPAVAGALGRLGDGDVVGAGEYRGVIQ